MYWLTLLCCAHLNRKVTRRSFVGKCCHQSLAFSGFMVLSKQLRTEKNKVESWRRRCSSGCSSIKRLDLQLRVGWPFKTYFLSRTLFIPDFPVVLNSLKSSFCSSEIIFVMTVSQIMFLWQHGQCVECYLENNPLIPDLGPHSHCHWFLPNHSLLNLSNGRWAPIRFIYNFSSYDKD